MKSMNLNEMRKLSIAFVCATCFAIAGLGIMSEKQTPTQQIGGVCSYYSGETEGGTSSSLDYAANLCLGASVAVGYGALTNAWNPAGWVGFAVAGGAAL